MASTHSSYNSAIDLLRVLSILAVILIHTTTKSLNANHMDLVQHQSTLFLNQVSRFAVPLFFLISGFVLELSFKNNYLDYFKKRISKILVPYVFWSAVYYFLIYTTHSNNFLQSLLDGSASYQLYFIPALLILYFVFPLLHNLYTFLSNKFIFIFLLILQLHLLDSDYHLHGLNVFYPINIAVLNFMVFILGMIAFRNQKKILAGTKKLWPLLLFLILFLAKSIFNEGLINYYRTYNFEYYYSQWRPSVFAYTIAFALLAYYIFSKVTLPKEIIKQLSSLSFLVFFIHTLILELVFKNLNLGDMQLFLVVSTISFVVAYLLHQIPKLSVITG